MNEAWSDSLRCNFEYSGSDIVLKSWNRLNKRSPRTDPIENFEEELGWWITLNDENGNVVYRQIINNPIRVDKEVFLNDQEAGVRWELPEYAESQGSFTVLVPDIHEATHLSVYGGLDELADASGPSREILTIDLRIEELREDIKTFMIARVGLFIICL